MLDSDNKEKKQEEHESSENLELNTLDINEKDKIDELVENEVLSNSIIMLFVIFISLSVLIAGHSILTMVKMSTDKSIPLVICPQTYDLDAPVVMSTIKDAGIVGQDRWIRGFIRRYVSAQFPRTGQDAREKFKYLVNHSKNNVAFKYQEFLDEIEEITKFIDSGNYYKFYPIDSKDIRIRNYPDTKDTWVVEIDGYLIKRSSGKEERYSPTLKYIVQAGESNMDNPEGLYVIDTSLEQITDYVAGSKKELINK